MTAPAPTFRLSPALSQYVPRPLAEVLAPPLERLLALDKLEKLYGGLPPTRDAVDFARTALAHLGVAFTASGALDETPATGPLIVVANHPCGGIEGLGLYALLAERRGDVRVLGNHWLARIPEFAPTLFAVDVFRGRAAATRNGAVLRQAARWVTGGGALIVFPSGEVSSLDPATRTVVDPAWEPSIGRLIALTEAPVVPVYFEGGNSPLFHAAGLVHPRLRTALLPRELVNKRARTIRSRIGRVIAPEQLAALGGDGPRVEYLRLRVYALAQDLPAPPSRVAAPRPIAREPVAAPVDPERVAADIAALPLGQRLGASGELEVWHARAAQVPWVLQEIGRLRELTFRAVGEGTGRRSDVDLFDRYYEQLFVWNPSTREVVGGYRIGHADRIRAKFGARGLYTSTLFRFRKPLLPALGAALELGRSFVRPEYQRSFAPLLLLWKGIAGYVVKHPEYRVLFGPVSISNDYSLASRTLLTGFLRSKHGDPELGRLARPRHPLPDSGPVRLVRRAAEEVGSLDALEALLTSIEADGKGVPVLLRQYLKLGARALAFNVDPAFGHSIDVLVAVDLLETDAKVLGKYMGRAAAEAYRDAHARAGAGLGRDRRQRA